MRFPLRRLFLAMTLVAGLFAFLAWNPLDGRMGAIHALIAGDQTQYAPKYTDQAFRKVALGMTQREVDALLGPPISMYGTKGVEIAEWSTTGQRVPYRKRIIEFGEGAVVEKLAMFEK